MDVDKVLHMTGGVGQTSYARNCSLQKKASHVVKHITLETIRELYVATTPKSLGIADLGCSSGHNSLSIIREMVDTIEEASRKQFSRPVPEFRICLNDLPTNDFNAIFAALPEFYDQLRGGRNDAGPPTYIAGYPGSFYGRLFPSESLHFIYSCYSLHWLSKVPPALYDEQGRSLNKESIYISESSPLHVSEAYLRQFQEDFSLFLKSRSEELIHGGKMVLILLGRMGKNHVDRGNSFFWELLAKSFAILVSKGEVEEEKLDMYNVPFYAPSPDELEDEIRSEGSFVMDRLEMFQIDDDIEDITSYGMDVAMTVRAIQESMISHHFGERILDSLFDCYGTIVQEEVQKEEIRAITFVLVLRKK